MTYENFGISSVGVCGEGSLKSFRRREVIRAVFKKMTLTTVWRMDPTLTPAWPLSPVDLMSDEEKH